MKRTFQWGKSFLFLISSFFMFLQPGLLRGEIQIHRPQGNEIFNCGQTIRIEWSSIGCGDRVRIDLRKEGQVFPLVQRTRNSEGTNRVSLLIPTSTPQGTYRIQIYTITGNSCSARSASFQVRCQTQTSSLTMVSPNGGESIRMETASAVRWTSTGISGNVNLILKKGGRAVKNATVPNTGSAYWMYTGVPAGSDYKFRVESTDGSVFDESNRNFTIQSTSVSPRPAKYIRVESPNGGETWQMAVVGESRATVRWSSSGIPGDVRVVLKKSGSIIRGERVPNTGSTSFSFTGVTPGNDYKIRVREPGTSIIDESDGSFTIQSATLSPQTGGIKPKITAFQINNGATETRNRIVTLNNTATGHPTHYRIEKRRTKTRYWTEWLPYSTAPSTDLPGSCGEETLQLQVKNMNGESEPVGDSIIYVLDTTHNMLAGCVGVCPCTTLRVSGWNNYRILEKIPPTAQLGVPVSCKNPDGNGNYSTIKIVVDSHMLYGQKIVVEFFAGRLLNPGWSLVSIKYRGTSGTYNIRRMPSAGGRDIRFVVSVFTEPNSPTSEFYIDGILVKGPCNKNVEEAFN